MHGRKKIRSECESIGFKNDRLNYKCKECGEKNALSQKMNQLKMFQLRINLAKVILINFFCCYEKVFILMRIRIASEILMKLQYHLKKLFTAN